MKECIYPPLVKTLVVHLLTHTSTEQALDLLVLLHGVLVGSLVVEGVEDLAAGGAGGRHVVHVPHVPRHGLPQARLVPVAPLEPLVASLAVHVVCLD